MRADPSNVHRVVPFLHVADVEASVTFYALLGFDGRHVMRSDDGVAFWAHVWKAGDAGRVAEVMFARADGPIDAHQQAALLYMYANDVRELRERLLSSGVHDGGAFCGKPGPNEGCRVVFDVTFPFYMDEGEIRVSDPDGYCILVGQYDGWPDS